MNATEIAPNLWQGAQVGDQADLDSFDVVVDLNGEQLWPGHGGVLAYWSIEDGAMPDQNKLWSVASLAYEAWKRGLKVLVHCGAGINRSGLVTGCVLWLSGVNYPVEAIRAKRPGSLSNQNFEGFLRGLKRQ